MTSTREDFDILSLADYLHLTPSQVQRMADRDQLPGRKIGGQWRFSAGEIHHWLEDRIGVYGDIELSQVEGLLERDSPGNSAEVVTLSELIPYSAIAVPLLAKTRNSVISAMVEAASTTGFLWDPAKLAEAVRARENLHSTALENGISLLHPRRPMPNILAEPFVALGITAQGIPFGGDRGILTDVFFLICSVEDRGHLRVLARLSRLIAQPSFPSELRAARDAHDVLETITKFEEKIV